MRFVDTSEALAEYIPQQKQFRREFRYCLPKVLSCPVRHWHNPEAFAFSRAYFETLGHCPDRARRFLRDTGLIEFGDEYSNIETENQSRFCQEAHPTELFHEIQAALQNERYNLCNVTTNRKARKRPDTVFFDGVAIEGECPVDLLALQDFILDKYKHCKQLDGSPVSNPLVWRDYGMAFQRLAIARNGPYGCVPQFFDISPNTNRIHSLNFGIQNVHRALRTALLNGCHSADINNAFFCILSQLGKYPSVADYATHPNDTRNAIASDVGVTYEQAKIALLSMLNGARLHPNNAALVSHLGSYDKAHAFWYHDTVTAIRRDCVQARKDKGFTSPKQFAAYLMRKEQELARVMAQGTRLVLPLHDAIITREPIDAEKLQHRIYQQTGFHTKITTKEYAHEFSREKSRG